MGLPTKSFVMSPEELEKLAHICYRWWREKGKVVGVKVRMEIDGVTLFCHMRGGSCRGAERFTCAKFIGCTGCHALISCCQFAGSSASYSVFWSTLLYS